MVSFDCLILWLWGAPLTPRVLFSLIVLGQEKWSVQVRKEQRGTPYPRRR